MGISDAPINYSPVYDFTGELPWVPTSVRASTTTKTAVAVRWSFNSDDTRPTDFVVQRRDVTDEVEANWTAWANVATVLHTETSTTTAGVTTVKYKNVTTYDDTIPNTTTSHTYQYQVKATNVEGSSVFSEPGEVESLTDDEVYVMGLETKMMNSLPLTMDEAATLITWDRVKGAQAAAMIANRIGTYANFKNEGFSSSICLNLAVLALCMRDSNSLLTEQFNRAQAALTTNVVANNDFMTWAKDHLSFNLEDMLAAANTQAEKTAIIDWMKTHGYLTV
jgi:hypothetical protein